jgi:hypothetical protein
VLRVLAVVFMLAGVWFAYALYRAFKPKPRGPGDPGNSRLHQLAADPVFDALPPDARSPSVSLNPAKWRAPAFQSAGWSGPSVILTFESSAGPRLVYEYYAEQVAEHGWIATLKGSLHIYDRWKKTYANGAQAWLSISTNRPWEPAPEPRQYTLTGSISLPREIG